MSTSISIASSALVLIGHSTINSFDDGTAGATVANQFYNTSYEALLQLHRWRFATKQATLTRLSEEPLMDEYTYTFQLPTDMLYLIKTEHTANYEVYEDKLFSNHINMKIDYIFKPKEDKLPAYFVKMMEFYLASQFAVPVTGNATRAQTYMIAYEKSLLQAKHIDSSQRPNRAIRSNPYINVRFR